MKRWLPRVQLLPGHHLRRLPKERRNEGIHLPFHHVIIVVVVLVCVLIIVVVAVVVAVFGLVGIVQVVLYAAIWKSILLTFH